MTAILHYVSDELPVVSRGTRTSISPSYGKASFPPQEPFNVKATGGGDSTGRTFQLPWKSANLKNILLEATRTSSSRLLGAQAWLQTAEWMEPLLSELNIGERPSDTISLISGHLPER